jgi:hypothetical protein
MMLEPFANMPDLMALGLESIVALNRAVTAAPRSLGPMMNLAALGRAKE